jgi:hypothetical protein
MPYVSKKRIPISSTAALALFPRGLVKNSRVIMTVRLELAMDGRAWQNPPSTNPPSTEPLRVKLIRRKNGRHVLLRMPFEVLQRARIVGFRDHVVLVEPLV